VNVSILNAPPVAAFMSFTTPLASSTAATGGANIEQGGYAGTIQFNFTPTPNPASSILVITFQSGLFSGGTGNNSAGLSASQPTGLVTYTAGPTQPQLAAAIAASTGRNFSLSFAGLQPGLSTTGSPLTVNSFTSSLTGLFSTTVAVPEPGSVVMASISLLAGLGCFGFRRRFMVG